MRNVDIESVRVDSAGRLRVRPAVRKDLGGYSMIFRAAAWIRWDTDTKELYVAEDKDESWMEQFSRIVRVIEAESDNRLIASESTDYQNTPCELIEFIRTF